MNQNQITECCIIFHNEIMAAIHTNYSDFTCKTKWDWSLRRTTSWGGPRGISIAMVPYYTPKISTNNPMLFTEYASFKNRLDIGQFWYDDLLLGYKAVICHEVAHALCSYLSCFKEAHGDSFKLHYGNLRNIFVNPYIKRSLTGDLDDVLSKFRDKQAEDYLNFYSKFGLKKEWLNKEYTSGGKYRMKIIGLNPRARKYPVIARRLFDSKVYKMPSYDVIRGMNAN